MGDGIHDSVTGIGDADRPAVSQSMSFGADTLVVTSFVISLGIPIYHSLGLWANPAIVVAYVLSAALVPTLVPLFAWTLRWGRPGVRPAAIVAGISLLHAVPAMVVVMLIVSLGLETALIGVGVMTFVAAVLILVTSPRFGSSAGLPRMTVVRLACAVGTPVVVLGLTSALPHGFDAISGWSIPMLVAGAGAIGSARGMRVVCSKGYVP